ncbi:unnamed protein product [Effrenium voratum]|nr:unnamed protein product [Effrenium voratum]
MPFQPPFLPHPWCHFLFRRVPFQHLEVSQRLGMSIDPPRESNGKPGGRGRGPFQACQSHQSDVRATKRLTRKPETPETPCARDVPCQFVALNTVASAGLQQN